AKKHLSDVLRAAAAHRGSAFVEIYQNCNIFNDGAFEALKGRTRASNRIFLEHGKPIRFGVKDERGVVARGTGKLEIVDVDDVGEDNLLVHDAHRDDPSLAFALSRLADGPTMPTPLGVLRAVDRPVYGDAMEAQLRATAETKGHGDLQTLLTSGDTWMVN
ncbi:MAG: 2-oxoacid:ferredoxin oxidoreductase subunit beta, partial [Actinomycetota bacterium]